VTPDFAAAASALGEWYDAHGRKSLPWRNESDPYRVYVSEIMLQQTQVATVASRFYFPFLRKFPTLSALAGAEIEYVLKAWEGLGYYSRARNMHKAAQLAAPMLPPAPEDLKKLPGIGEYVAHAVACFGFGRQVPVVDVNVRRVLCRLTASRHCTDKEIWRLAWRFLDTRNAFRHNQALLDVGAGICTARKAACGICPLSPFCAGKGDPLRYPAPKQKKEIPEERIHVAICEQGDKIALYRRETNFLGGYYSLPALPEGALKSARFLGCATQAYSHKRIEAYVYAIPAPPPEWQETTTLIFAPLKEAERLPLSAIDRKMLAFC